LIAENKFACVEVDRGLNLDFEVCTSALTAIQRPSAFPYQLIMSGALLAEMDDFFLLKRTEALESFVPFLVTAITSEKASARRVLDQGALHLSSPIQSKKAWCTSPTLRPRQNITRENEPWNAWIVCEPKTDAVVFQH
jgi:PleD family two-component response regulator